MFKNKLFTFILIITITSSVFSQNFIDSSSFVFIEGGCFLPGSTSGDEDERNGKKIRLNSYYISKFEISNYEYCFFLNNSDIKKEYVPLYINLNGKSNKVKCRIYVKDNVYKVETGFENFPICFVSWHGAQAFCKYTKTRLPTETEWEYAAKGGKYGCKIYKKKKYLKKCFTYSGSNNPDSVAWFSENSDNSLHKTGQKKPNMLGIFDMCGNLSEWCYDTYSATNYSECKRKKNKYSAKGTFKVHRGGSWTNSKKIIRLSNRRASNPQNRNATIGFRIVKD